MAVSAAKVTVGTTPTALNAAGPGGNTLNIKNGAAVVTLGPSNVTATTGLTVAAAAERTIELDAGDVLFAVTAAGTSDVEVLRT